MSRSRFSTARGVIGRLEVNNIRLIHDKTDLKWSGRLKNKDIRLVNGGSTAKLSLFRSGEKAVLGSKSVIIGTDNLSWSLDINKGQTIQCGIALVTRNLSTTDTGNDLISTQLSVEAGDRIILLLNAKTNTITIEHNEVKQVFYTSSFTGQTMYPWLSDVSGTSGFIVKINEYQVINMEIDVSGTARINTVQSVETTSAVNTTAPLIIDAGDKGIGLGAVNVSKTNIQTQPGKNFSVTAGSSGQGLTVQDPNGDVQVDTKIQVDAIEPKSGSTSLTITGGGSSGITIDNIGNVTVNTGAIITSSIKAPSGSGIGLTNESGVGVQVSATGIVTFDTIAKVGEIQSVSGNDLTLTEGTSGLGIEIKDTTGEVTITGPSMSCNIIDTSSATALTLGASTATKVELADSGVDTEIKGNLAVLEGLDVTGNITVSGTVDGVDITTNTTGLVSVHSDVDISGPVDNEILQFSNGTGTWVNRNLAAAGIAAANHTHTTADITDFNTASDTRITLQKGNANGIATLNGAGKVPLSQLPLNAVEYQGTWDAGTNTPTLTPSSGIQGRYYVVTGPGSTNLDGISDWKDGDWAIYNGSVWEKVDNTDSVTSVAGKQGAVTLQATDLTDVSDAGSGSIITGAERTQIGTNITNATGTVTIHSDVTDAGSGAIITSGERALIGTNNTNATGSVTIHSDVTDAGSGAIITASERSKIANLPADYLPLTGGTMSGNIDMDSNDITNVNNLWVNNDVIVGNNLTVTGEATFRSDCKIEGGVEMGTGVNRVTLYSGTSAAARSYDIQDQGVSGTLAVMKTKKVLSSITAYTSDQTIIIPADVTQIQVKLWGAGGHSGESASDKTNLVGGNGGGGGYVTSTIGVVPGDTYQITIGPSAGGGAGGEVAFEVNGDFRGGHGGGKTMCHHFKGGLYHVVAVAAGGGGGCGKINNNRPVSAGGGGGVDGQGGAIAGKTSTFPAQGGSGANTGNINGLDGTDFIDPVSSITQVGGEGASGPILPGKIPGPGGGGDGYGGGGSGGTLGSGLELRSGGGGGGGNFGQITEIGSGTTPGNNSDTDKQNAAYGIQNAGFGGIGVSVTKSQNAGIGGAALVYMFSNSSYIIGLQDDTTADANEAIELIINGADKTAGTGNGGKLILRGGASVGGTAGHVEVGSKLIFTPQTEPSGVAGDVYYDSGTNKLRVHNGTSFIDLH